LYQTKLPANNNKKVLRKNVSSVKRYWKQQSKIHMSVAVPLRIPPSPSRRRARTHTESDSLNGLRTQMSVWSCQGNYKSGIKLPERRATQSGKPQKIYIKFTFKISE
jgi:hypothetical protein